MSIQYYYFIVPHPAISTFSEYLSWPFNSPHLIISFSWRLGFRVSDHCIRHYLNLNLANYHFLNFLYQCPKTPSWKTISYRPFSLQMIFCSDNPSSKSIIIQICEILASSKLMYGAQYAQIAQRFPYTQAEDYSSIDNIFEAYPHLKLINQHQDWSKRNITGIVIRSANDDNVHKGIKYGIWTTTLKNRSKLNQMYIKAKSEGRQIYLFFSVVKSGMFEGVAKLASNLIEDTFPYWWEDFTHKFKDYFKIQWVYIKDVNFYHFDKLLNIQSEEVTQSKDCDQIDSQTTQKMLQIFDKKPIKNKWIFNDFAYMDKRQKQYTRKSQSPYQVEYPAYQMMGYYPNIPNEQTIPLPPQMMKPVGSQSRAPDLGFQKNPVSKNRKK